MPRNRVGKNKNAVVEKYDVYTGSQLCSLIVVMNRRRQSAGRKVRLCHVRECSECQTGRMHGGLQAKRNLLKFWAGKWYGHACFGEDK